MNSKISSKFQVTIPRKVRESLKLATSGSIEWNIEDGRITVAAGGKGFLKYRNSLHVGKGDIKKDIETARSLLGKRYV